MPVPVPAVVNIAADNALRLRLTQTRGEMITRLELPSRHICPKAANCRKSFVIEKIGLGAGKKEFCHCKYPPRFLIRD